MDNTTLTDDLIAEIERVDDMDGIHMIAHSDMKALIAEIRSLRELVGPIEGKGKTIHHEGHMYYPPEMVHSLMARMRSLRADAERYRGMRAIVMKSTGMAEDEYNSRADDVIALDAAMQARK